MKYVFDFDETIVDDYWFVHVNGFLKQLGREPIKSLDEMKTRFYADGEVFTTPEELHGFEEHLQKQTPYVGMEPRPKSAEVLKRLNDNGGVLIATAVWPISGDYVAKECNEKKRFINRFLPFLDTEKQIRFGNNKSVLSGFSMTDDAMTNLTGKFDRKLLYTAHHNKNITNGELEPLCITRVNDWYDIGEILN